MTKPISPLIENDFQMYDTTPDGRLFLNEFGDNLHSFVEKYIHTDDRNVRDTFRSAMENSIWEAVQKAIMKMAKGDIEDKVLKDRITYILEYEFPAKPVSGYSNAEVEHNEEKETSGQDADRYELEKSTNTYKLTQNLSLRAPLNTSWLMTGNASVTASQNQQRQTEYTDSAGTSSDYSYLGTIGSGYLGFQTRDDFFKSRVGGTLTQNHQKPPPDLLLTSGIVNGGFELNNAWDVFSIRGNISYTKEKYSAPPADSDFFQNGTNALNISSEATYLFNPLGIVVDHSYGASDSSSHYSKDKTSTNSFSTLAQYTWKKSYVQAGGGYSVWDVENLFIGDEETLSYKGDAVYGTVKGQYQIIDKIRIDGSGTVNNNKSEGTFQGRYPSWSSDIKLSWTPDKWTMSAFLLYSGHNIDLNNSQSRHAVEGGADITYRPSDSLKISVSPSAKNSSVDGKNAYENDSCKINGYISYNIIGSIWLWTYAGGYLYRYKDDENSLSGFGWWSGGGAGVNY